MITDIKELNFPTYATLSSATATLNDMGDKTISTQVKIDGGIVPDFSFDWEVEFQGERYIQPLREPQASKGNESICSVIDLTFYHKTIYDLKRYFFVEMASTGSGTAMADKYIADLNVNLEQFKVALQGVLDFYFKGENRIEVKLYGEGTGIYAEEPQYVQIQYTHIWDVVQKIYDLFGVRWSIEGREIKIGYPTEEVAHTFEYGFEGGLLKVERQVQSADIRNSLLGRGGSKNLPYRYFKEADPQNPSFPADPDAIPELANIYFTELRGKTFRDYVKGWKAKHYGGEPMQEPTEAYTKGYTDITFNPIEYVEDKDSIAKYGLLQGGLENQEDIYPTIQGVEVDGLGRVDEIVGAEQVTVDEVTENTDATDAKYTQEISGTYTEEIGGIEEGTIKHFVIRTDVFETSDSTVVPYLAVNPSVEAIWDVQTKSIECYRTPYNQCRKSNGRDKYPLKVSNISIGLFFAESDEQVVDTSTLESGTKYYIKLEGDVSDFPTTWDKLEYNGVNNTYYGSRREFATEGTLSLNYSCIVKNIPYNGLIVKSDESKVQTTRIEAKSTKTLKFSTQSFQVPTNGAMNVNVPINIATTAQGLYLYETSVKAVNVNTREVVSTINIPQGEYYLEVSVDITNNSDNTEEFKVEMMSAYIILPTDTEEWQPTFDIWVKNIWGTTRNAGESADAYANRVWTPILGDREGNEAKVVFTTGWLAGHSDYEFVIRDVEYAGGSGVELGEVPAEWKITLIKSDAEVEATGKWIPSTTQQANAGDKFFFIGIDMPHEYTLWAEQAVDNYKADQLLETAHIKPTWVVQTDKVRLNQLQEGESELLLNALKIGNSLRLADTRFTNGIAQTLFLQSVTYTWDAQTSMYPNVEVVLSDKVVTTTNPVAQLQGEVDALTKQVGSLSNIQQVVRAIGDKLYLRKDGFEEVSNSPTEFNKLVSSLGYRQGAVGGNGWGLRSEQGKGIFEVDKLIVRDEMQVNSLVVNQVSAIGGKEILSAASITCSRVETTEQGFKCYFDQKRGSVANLFQVNDIAYSQVFNANDIEVKYYKREVIEVGDNYILLSFEGDGNGAPQEGDVIAQYGNTDTENNANRQYVIIRDVVGGGYERMLSDLNSVNAEGVEYYFAGRLDGNTPRWFVGNADGDFIEWEDGKLKVKGSINIEKGSTGVENLVGLPEKVQETIMGMEVGGQNLLRNSGFTGDYLSEQLADDSVLDATNQMFNPPFVHWEYSNATIQDSDESASGKEVVLNNGSLTQTLDFPIVANDTYMLSFKAKGTSLTYQVGGVQKTITLTNEWGKFVEKINTTVKSDTFSISGNGTLCEIQLERGTIATAWSNSPFDNSSDRAYYQALKYVSDALTEGSTTIDGGLVLTRHIKVGAYADGDMIKETGGMQGTWSSDNSPFLWGGGTLEQAAKAISENGEGEDEANFVVTHGGKAILNDAVVRGTVYASDGMFTGTVNATSGEFNNVDVQTGKIADFEISGSHLGIQEELGGNGMFLYNQYIGFRESEDGYKREAIVGENILPAEAGITGLAKYENTTTDTFEAMAGTGYGVISNVSGYKHSYAFASEKGVFAGFRPHVAILGSDNSPLQLGKYHHTILAWYGGTIVLDGTPENGQEYEIICPNTSVEEGRVQIITYDGTKKNIYLMLDGIERSSFSVHDLRGTRQVVKLVYFAQNDTWFAWHHTY